MIYLDYAASTPTNEEVLKAFDETTKTYYANPNSSHKLGRLAKEKMDESTKAIADLLSVSKEEIIYTSGATESNNLVIKGICNRYKNRGKHILISSLEHNSIVASATAMQELGFEIELIPVMKDGIIDFDFLKSHVRQDTILVSVCTVDSEIGLRQPIEEIGLILKEYPNCFFHTDASQAIGKTTIDFTNVDLATLTPHKFYGLSGISILLKKKEVGLKPQMDGGKSTTIYRSGTPDLASIVASKKALELAFINQEKNVSYITSLSKKVKDTLQKYPKIHLNSRENSLPHTINFSMKKVKAMDLQERLEQEEIYVSTKTSCCPVNTPSKLIYALTQDKGLSTSSIRVSISHLTTEEEIDTFLKTLDKIYKEYEENGTL